MPADRSSSEDDPAEWAQRPSTDPSSDGPARVPELRAALRAGSPAERADALRRALPGPGVEEAVLEALTDPAPEVRRTAVRTLGRLGGASGMRSLLAVALADPSPPVRGEAVAVLEGELKRRLGDRPAGP